MNNIIAVNTIRFIVLVLVQVLILSHINFLGYLNPQVYILFIILFPIKNNRMLFLFLSFLLGLTIDVFLDSGGVNAAACTLLAFVRPAILSFCFGATYEFQTVKLNQVDFTQKSVYISIATLIHHLTLFSLEIFNTSKIILILQKTLFSSIFTILLCVLISTLFSKQSK